MRKFFGMILCITLLPAALACNTTTAPSYGMDFFVSAEPIRIVAQTITAEPRPESATAQPLPTEVPTPEPTDTPPPTPAPAASAAPASAQVPTSHDDRALALVQSAMDRLGKPYVKGGESDEEGGYDTSGLVYACLIEVGESVSRKTSRDYAKMENWTLITSYDAFQPGDLLFFRDAPEGEINVVAICIGGGEMIYASSSRGEVIRCSYRTNYWQSVFAHARRVF